MSTFPLATSQLSVTALETDTAVSLCSRHFAESGYRSHAALVLDMKALNSGIDWTATLSGLVVRIPVLAG